MRRSKRKCARPTPPWNKGITAIDAEATTNAIECGKQSGDSPACLFWDTDLCKNDDSVLAWYTPYKQVASRGLDCGASKEGRAAAELCRGATSTRRTIGITRANGSNVVERLRDQAGRQSDRADRTIHRRGWRSILGMFDYPAFAPTAPVTLELVGKIRTLLVISST